MGYGMSVVDGCQIVGGREGIVTHMALVDVRRNRVQSTALRAISVTEMSMGTVERNHVRDAVGVGIYCGDRSECTIEDNRIVGTRADPASGDVSRLGYGIQAYFDSLAEVRRNRLVGNARDMSTLAGAEIVHR